jgi:hypothetical protein
MNKIFTQLFNQENEFFQLAKGAKRLTHISLSSFILPIVFFIIAGLLTQFVFAPLIIGSVGESTAWVRSVFGLFVMFGLGSLLIFLWVKFFEGRKIYTLGFIKRNALKNYLLGFGLGLLMNSVVVAIMALFGSIEISEESLSVTGFDAIGIVIIFLLGFIVQGASEEIMSRGWMMQVIGAKYKPWLGVLISTVTFSIFHLGNAGVNAPSVINLLLVAFLLALFVLFTKSLWFSCAWHSSWNWIMGNVYGLSVSGSDEKVTIIDLNTTGNELISGGGFGPEGSLVTTFVLLVAIVLYVFKLLKNISYTQVAEE